MPNERHSPEDPDSIAVAAFDRADARLALDAAATRSGVDVSTEEAELFERTAPLLDPGDSRDSRRILRHLTSSRIPGACLDAFLARVAAQAPDPETRRLADLVCGQNAMFAGDLREADRRVRGVLLESRGSGSRVERVAILALGRVSLQSRREFEALVLARRAVRAMDAAGDAWGSVISRLTAASVLSMIGDMNRLSEALDDLRPRTRGVTDPVRRPLVERTYRIRRAEVLESEGRHAAALHALVAAERVGGRLYPGEQRTTLILRAEILLADGRLERAADDLTTAAGLGPATDVRGLRIRARRLGLDVRREASTAVDDAGALLDDLQWGAQADVGPAARRELAIQIAEAVGPIPSALPLARRAYDLAAAAAFERLIELERFVRDVPESAAPTRDDLRVLEDLRRRTVAAQRDTHAAVARLIAEAAREGRTPVPMLPSDGGLICVCAWCQRVRTSDGVWLSIQQFLPLQTDGAIQLTHGICDACLPVLRGRLHGAEVGEA